jgi:hypothetical protein
MALLKFVSHSKLAVSIAIEQGWNPGARYTNLRDIKTFQFKSKCFLDIDWKNYSFKKHLDCAEITKPKLTIARDVESIFQLDEILKEAEQLQKHSSLVAIVPKDPYMAGRLEELIPDNYILAYSIPTRYGGTSIPTSSFKRPVHLLGGRPDVQRKVAQEMNVISLDCNRFTYDAKFGDYFDGETFRSHPQGGYKKCLVDSIKNINLLWKDYNNLSMTHELQKSIS